MSRFRERKNRMTDYKVGDKVIHACYGLGEIVGMDEKFIHERHMLCYIVRIGDLSIWVKADENGKSGLRRPTPEDDFDGLFAILSSPGEPLPWDRYERKLALAERMKNGELASICSVIRDLTFFRREKKFNDYDKTTMERARSFLFAEWMFSRSVSSAQVHDELTRLLE
jgi:RNA polymerase-interacting CarD/CdnL/TRCF family regulator